MKKLSFTFLSLALGTAALCQTPENLIYDKDISYVAEVYSYYNLEDSREESKDNRTHELLNTNWSNTTLKNESNSNIVSIYELLTDENRLKEMTLYKDAALTKKLTANQKKDILSSIDTIITFDPETFEESMEIVEQDIKTEDVEVIKVRQLIYYNEEDMMYYAQPTAMALLTPLYDAAGNYLCEVPLYWIPIATTEEASPLDNDDILWATQVNRSIALDAVRPYKLVHTLEESLEDQYQGLAENAETRAVYSSMTGNPLMSKTEVEEMVSSIDTIIIFDPETKKELVQVQTNHVSGQDMTGVRCLQDFYWDDNSKEMKVHFVGSGPVINKYDNQGNVLFAYTAFYRYANQLLRKE